MDSLSGSWCAAKPVAVAHNKSPDLNPLVPSRFPAPPPPQHLPQPLEMRRILSPPPSRLLPRALSTSAASSLHSIFASRRTSKKFLPSQPPIPPATLRSILATTLSTPTAFNLQPYHILLLPPPPLARPSPPPSSAATGRASKAR